MLSESFSTEFRLRQDLVNEFIHQSVEQWNPPVTHSILEKDLKKAMLYSLQGEGKRFRPVLCLFIGEAFAVPPKKILPWAIAIEMIHAYSLIHDDLPSMDNDDFRRGSPTNHKVFGETLALLAGDALQSEAFHTLSKAYPEDPQKNLELIRILAEASGLFGMAQGQAIDLNLKGKPSLDDLLILHSLKTGALIRACAEGVGVLCGLPANKVKTLREFGTTLGLAFQLKDDLLDSTERVEPVSFPSVLGVEGTKSELMKISSQAKALLADIGIQRGPLLDLIDYNQDRSH